MTQIIDADLLFSYRGNTQKEYNGGKNLGLNFDEGLEKVWAPWIANKNVGVQERTFEARERDGAYIHAHALSSAIPREFHLPFLYQRGCYEDFFIKKL